MLEVVVVVAKVSFGDDVVVEGHCARHWNRRAQPTHDVGAELVPLVVWTLSCDQMTLASIVAVHARVAPARCLRLSHSRSIVSSYESSCWEQLGAPEPP